MSLIRSAILIAVGLGVLGIDAGDSWRTGSLRAAGAHAQKHHRHRRHRRHHRSRRHHHAPPPATEM